MSGITKISLNEVLAKFDNEIRDGKISPEELGKNGGAKILVGMWRQLGEQERSELYARLDDKARQIVTLELVNAGAPASDPVTAELRKLKPLFTSQVAEARRWNRWDTEGKSLQRAFTFLAERVQALYPALAAFINASVKESNDTREWRESVEDVLRPAAEFISKKLETGPTTREDDCKDLAVVFNLKVAEANRWNTWDGEGKSLLRAIEHTIPIVEHLDANLAEFMRKSLRESDAAGSWRESVEDVLRPAVKYIIASLQNPVSPTND